LLEKGKKLNSAKIWPYGIGVAILTFFGAIVFSITLILKEAPVQVSVDMMDYHHADANANELIQAKIDFNEKYKIEYMTEGLSELNSTLKYRISDLENNPVSDATIIVIITRPDNNNHTQKLINPSVDNGIYIFDSVTLSQAGRWNVMAKVDVGELTRYYNVKADTRSKSVYEY
jgi:nitrogen fixation protein FixH